MIFLLWKGNSIILLKIGNRLDWTEEPLRKLVVLLVSYILYTGLLVFVFTYSWYLIIVGIDINWTYVLNMILILIISVLFISHIYETKVLIANTIIKKQHTDQLELASMRNELNALKSQIDPHFIFNSLNTLGFLIEHDKEKATSFNQNLAELYQYILNSKNKGLVTLKQEIEIAQKYFLLMRIRFGDDIKLIINPNVIEFYHFLIPSVSLQILIENAIKHNKFNKSDNLLIQVSVINKVLIVSNRINKVKNLSISTGIGLENLSKRYNLLAGESINLVIENETFYIKIPLIKNSSNESTDN